jgi:hypothetical protein
MKGSGLDAHAPNATAAEALPNWQMRNNRQNATTGKFLTLSAF